MKDSIVEHYKTKTSMIVPRTNGGYRVVLIDSYFDIQKEVFTETLGLAELYSKTWLGKDNDEIL